MTGPGSASGRRRDPGDRRPIDGRYDARWDLPDVPAGRAFADFLDGARRSEADGEADVAASGV